MFYQQELTFFLDNLISFLSELGLYGNFQLIFRNIKVNNLVQHNRKNHSQTIDDFLHNYVFSSFFNTKPDEGMGGYLTPPVVF